MSFTNEWKLVIAVTYSKSTGELMERGLKADARPVREGSTKADRWILSI